MFQINDLLSLRYDSDDYEKTEQLKLKLLNLRKSRNPMYLNLLEFDEILRWKLRNQFGRQGKLRAENTDTVVREVTRAVFSINHTDKDYETELKLGLLCTIKGVGVPVASAILALLLPNDYCVIDFRGWSQIFGKKKNSFTINDYKLYLAEVQKIASQIGWPVQEVDLAIWELDRRKKI
jgi:thermostable 8-oxoguanine DNA glycosylase